MKAKRAKQKPRNTSLDPNRPFSAGLETHRDPPPEKTLQRELVEDTIGHWPASNCPTTGYLLSALEVLGFPVRGQKKLGSAWRAQLMKLANENGLDFVEATTEKDDDNAR